MSNITITKMELSQFRHLIEQECGISISMDKAYLLESRLTTLALKHDCRTFGDFYFKASQDSALRALIVDAMTTNETFWFRDEFPFTTIKDHLFPEFLSLLRQDRRKKIQIWSAACSSGQEPYSISILANEFARCAGALEFTQGKLSILGTDISPSILERARKGEFDAVSMSRGMPDDLRLRYFDSDERMHTIRPEVRNLVTFRQINLMHSFRGMGPFDLVLLRNVAIYFSESFKTELFKKIAGVLHPGGYLILGASESLHGYSQDFVARDHGRCHYYQLRSPEDFPT